MLTKEIQSNLSEPAVLERLYRQNPSAFKSAFLEIYEEGKRFIQTEFDIKHIIASIQELHIKMFQNGIKI